MNPEELMYVGSLWEEYFPKEIFFPQDTRLTPIIMFRDFFSDKGKALLPAAFAQKRVYFNVQELNEGLPFPDFEANLRTRPAEVMGCVGLALSLIAKQRSPYATVPFLIRPRFFALTGDLCFGDLKSSCVGQLVSLRGHVVRVGACRPLIERAAFRCAKCLNACFTRFEDGIFLPPAQCATPKCYNKFLELDRGSVTTSDFQRVKLTELDDIDAESARVPRSVEVEVRGSLVNTCVAGDVLCVVGVVRALQTDAPKGAGKGKGYKESGLYTLYVLANSLLCLKGSGDRGTSKPIARSGTGAG
ncbi:hypothetical protein B484DRAFT_97099, partial [Ochromonadaceae sp. CCMP2298]